MLKEELTRYQHLIEAACPYPPPEIDLAFRRMFGGLGLYVRGRIFAIVTNEGLAFKLDDYAQGELKEDAPDARTLSWTAKYLIAPAYVMDDPARLSDWIQRSIEYVLSQPPKKRGKGRR
ncbi:MAG TPA: TfoX/Sxy family protein [Candidatus Limnocylindrales bacterium]|nr:TfoX/Sxy family protein [Candidatus Limnocylindrales bacterium]